MTTAYTSLLGLALPVTGELSGTWGDTVNNSITSLLDSAIAGTTTLSSDVDVTLTTTTGASNTSRQAILLWTAGGTVTRNITAPAQSKIYTVINASSSTQSIVLRGVGPTTGVTIVKGESAVCAWNGSDFIKISNTGGAAVFTTLDVTNLEVTNIKALDGTSAASIANSTGVISLTANPILSGGTANGVAYLNGSKVLTTGSALTFSGSALAVTGSISSTGGFTSNTTITAQLDGSDSAGAGPGFNLFNTAFTRGWRTQLSASNNKVDYYFNGAAYVAATTIDTSGNLGLGVTPSAWASTFKAIQVGAYGVSLNTHGSLPISYLNANCYYNGSNWIYTTSSFATQFVTQGQNGSFQWQQAASGTAGNAITFTQAMTLDASGRLLVGLTSSLNGNGAVQAGGFSDTRVVIDGSSTQGIFFTKSGADNGTYRVDASGNYNWFVKGAGTANMTLDVSGNLLVGTTNNAFSSRLCVQGTASSSTPDVTVGIPVNGDANTCFTIYRSANTSGYVGFETFNAGVSGTSLVINSNNKGKVLIGGTNETPYGDTTGIGSTAIWQNRLFVSSNADCGSFNRIGSDGIVWYWVRGGTGNVGNVSVSTTGTGYNSTSDYRLKNVTGSLTGYKERLMALQPKQGTWIADGSEFKGFLAHEFADQYPKTVTGEKDAVDADGKPMMQSMEASSAEVIADLVALAQEQQALITQLTARITALEGA